MLSALTAALAVALVPSPVAIENARPGTSSWAAPATAPAEIYATEVGAVPGGTLHFHVSTAVTSRYRVELYRLGWYGGRGGRLVGCSPSCTTDEPGISQAQPSLPSADPYQPAVQARWVVTDEIRTSRSFLSGYYLARVIVTAGSSVGPAGETFVILRQPRRSRPTQVLVQAAVNTWQAYNDWGGASLYDIGHPRSFHVSFDRPYGPGAQGPGIWELPLIRFLERLGIDVSYQTDLDTHLHPGSLARHRLVIVAGHDEYWTKAIRDGFEAALAHGVNLAFIGANIGFWQMRYSSTAGPVSIDEYRSADADPSPEAATKTVRFRRLSPPRGECALLGVSYVGGSGAQTDFAVTADAVEDPWFAGTDFVAGDTVRGVVGYEWDTYDAECAPPGTTVLFHGNTAPFPVDAVKYTAASGARVFSAGSVAFSWGLDDFDGHTADPRLQRFMRNMLRDLAAGTGP